MLHYKKGFTLIELLVVVAIIGLLSSVVLVSLNVVRGKGRDSSRLNDVKQIVNALSLYSLDNNGNYPLTPSGAVCDYTGTGWSDLGTILSSYIKVLPRDPSKNSNWGYCYYNDGNRASITFYTENNMPNMGNTTYGGFISFYKTYLHTRYLNY